MILLIDNYDSFSYNVYQLIGAINPDMKVIRNDELTIEEIEDLAPSHIVISPGPGHPRDAGICEAVIRHFQGAIPILGICLGHQAICEVYGATVTYARELMHGKQSTVTLDTGSLLFAGMEEQTAVARYHSLAASQYTAGLPAGHGHRAGRGDYGGAAPGVSGVWGSVSSGIGVDSPGKRYSGKFFGRRQPAVCEQAKNRWKEGEKDDRRGNYQIEQKGRHRL